jgi:hypothetical protein
MTKRTLVRFAIAAGLFAVSLIPSRASADPRWCAINCDGTVACSYHCYNDNGIGTTCGAYDPYSCIHL